MQEEWGQEIHFEDMDTAMDVEAAPPERVHEGTQHMMEGGT